MTYPSGKTLDPEPNIHRDVATQGCGSRGNEGAGHQKQEAKIEAVDADYGNACDYELRALTHSSILTPLG